MEAEGRKIDTEDMDRGTNSDILHSITFYWTLPFKAELLRSRLQECNPLGWKPASLFVAVTKNLQFLYDELWRTRFKNSWNPVFRLYRC